MVGESGHGIEGRILTAESEGLIKIVVRVAENVTAS
jgi:hypothetical protein